MPPSSYYRVLRSRSLLQRHVASTQHSCHTVRYVRVHSRAAAMLITALLLALSSCSVQSTLVSVDNSDCAGSGMMLCYDTVIRTSAWKTKTLPFIRARCQSGYMSRVRMTTKPLDVVLSVLTLGFVVKHRIQWDCAQAVGDPPPIGRL